MLRGYFRSILEVMLEKKLGATRPLGPLLGQQNTRKTFKLRILSVLRTSKHMAAIISDDAPRQWHLLSYIRHVLSIYGRARL